jgi:hypothetical protein
MRKDIDEAKDEIIRLLENGTPRFEVCRLFRCKYDTLVSRLKKWGVSHLKNPAGKGIAAHNQRVSVSAYLIYGSSIKSHKLKLKLIEESIKKHECEICLNSEWMGKPIPLELHHKDGDHCNNVLENLQILCPTCHAQQPGNSGAKIGKTNPQVFQLEEKNDLESLKCGFESHLGDLKKLCFDCNKPISKHATRCKSCKGKQRKTKISWPSTTDLLQEVEETSYLATGKRLGVSDNAVRKRMRNYPNY